MQNVSDYLIISWHQCCLKIYLIHLAYPKLQLSDSESNAEVPDEVDTTHVWKNKINFER